MHSSIFVLATALIVSASGKKLPEYVESCSRNSQALGSCMISDLIHSIKPHLEKGIEAMAIPSLEPLEIEDFEVDAKEKDVDLKLKVSGLQIWGGSDFNIDNLRVNWDVMSTHADIMLPLLKAKCNYQVEGTILDQPLKGSGVFKSNFSDLLVNMKALGKLVDNSDNEQVTDITTLELKAKIRDAEGSATNTDGNKDNDETTRKAVDWYHKNRRKVLDTVLPIAIKHAHKHVEKIAKKITRTVLVDEAIPENK
jgi:hypothetical protein